MNRYLAPIMELPAARSKSRKPVISGMKNRVHTNWYLNSSLLHFQYFHYHQHGQVSTSPFISTIRTVSTFLVHLKSILISASTSTPNFLIRLPPRPFRHIYHLLISISLKRVP